MKSTAKRILDDQQAIVTSDKSFNEKTGNKNLDLNDLLKRHRLEKSDEQKFTILIISSILAVVTTLFLIFSL